MIKKDWFKFEILAIPLVLLFAFLSMTVVSVFSKDAKTYLSRGYMYWERGNYGKALSAFNKAIEMKPDFAEAYVARSIIYLRENDDLHSVNDLLQAKKLDPDFSEEIKVKNNNPAMYLVRGFILAGHKNTIPKSSFLGLNLMNDINNPYNPNNPNGFLEDVSLSEIRVKPGMDAGEDVVREIAKGDFDKLWTILQQSYNKRDQALADFSKAIEIKSNFAEAYKYRGGIEDDKRAIADFTKAIEIDPYYGSPYWARGSIYSKQNKYTQAINDFKKAIQKSISGNYCSVILATIGNIYEKQGKYEDAIVQYRKILELKPNDKNRDEADFFSIGTFYMDEKKYEEAVDNFTKAIDIKPNESISYYERAVCYYALNDLNKTWQDVNKAKELGLNMSPSFLEDLKRASGRQE